MVNVCNNGMKLSFFRTVIMDKETNTPMFVKISCYYGKIGHITVSENHIL